MSPTPAGHTPEWTSRPMRVFVHGFVGSAGMRNQNRPFSPPLRFPLSVFTTTSFRPSPSMSAITMSWPPKLAESYTYFVNGPDAGFRLFRNHEPLDTMSSQPSPSTSIALTPPSAVLSVETTWNDQFSFVPLLMNRNCCFSRVP